MDQITVTSIARKIDSEASAYLYMEQLRWPNGPVCPHCAHTKAYFLKPANGISRTTTRGSASQRRVWKCAKCRKQFSVTTGTIFHGSKVSLQTWLFVFFEMCANKNGLAAREVERKYGVAPKTAWFITHRIREAMKVRSPKALVGTIVADETYIGGEPKNRHGHRPGMGWQATQKTPVVSLINADTGEARSRVITNVTRKNLRTTLAEQVDMGHSVLFTDESHGYISVGREFTAHHTVNHRDREYLDPRTGATTNLAENFFSQLKRSLTGTHHNVSKLHLQRYLWEFDFRYSTCKQTDTERTMRLFGQVGDRRLSYKRVMGI